MTRSCTCVTISREVGYPTLINDAASSSHALQTRGGNFSTVGFQRQLPLRASISWPQMQRVMASTSPQGPTEHKGESLIGIEVFCLVVASYVAFIVADEDMQHVVDMKELEVLLWLMWGKEPAGWLVGSVMKSLGRDENGVLSAVEWVSYAVESDARTGNFSFATQVQLLFTCADRNGNAVLNIQKLITALKPVLLENVLRHLEKHDKEAKLKLERALGMASEDEPTEKSAEGDEDPPVMRRRRQSQADTVQTLITGLANELMRALDKNQSNRIEWFEFQQHLDNLQERVQQTRDYIHRFVLSDQQLLQH